MNANTIVSYDNIEKVYGEGEEAVRALNAIDIDVEAGEFISIVGPSGCGKSTLLLSTAGLIEPTAGVVSVDGVNVQSPSYERYKTGLVFQKPVLLDWRTVIKNVVLPAEIMTENGVLEEDKAFYREEAERLIELVGLGGFERAYPQELSGGMQQRVSICRSLVYDPPVLLMDEPFGALDEFTRDRLNDELLTIWGETNKTVIFVTHNIQEAVYLSDRVVVLSDRPGTVRDIVEIDLPRPREPEVKRDDSYHDLVTKVSDGLGVA